MAQFKRVLKVRTIVATAAGLAFCSSTFVAQMQVASFVAGESAWIAILISGAMCLLAAMCFSELNGQLPSAAGLRLFFARAFGERTGVTVSLVYMAVIMGVIGAESFIIGSILHEVMPSVPPIIWILLLISAVAVINIRGVKLAGGFQDTLTYGMIISLFLLAFLAFTTRDVTFTSLAAPGDLEGLVNAVALGVFLFVGFEWVTPLAEEVTDNKFIARGMMIAIGTLSVVYALFTVAMTSIVPKDILVASPIPHFIFAETLLGKGGVVWILILSLAATFTTFNAGLISVSRFMYASARENILPNIFSKISMRFLTPWVSILVLFGVAVVLSIVVLFTGRYLVLVNMAAAMESIVYAMAGAAVLMLRKREPMAERPYLVKGGAVIPVATSIIFGGLALAVLTTETAAALNIAIGFLISFIYVVTVVPYLKEQHAKKMAARRKKRRRPRRPAKPTETEG